MELRNMENFTLTPFNNDQKFEFQILANCKNTHDSIYVSYRITGNLNNIDLGETTSMHSRKLKLWEKTCFEFFIKNQNGQYYEFNFSPKFDWNIFYFDKLGDSLAELNTPLKPEIDILDGNNQFMLIAKIPKNIFSKNFIENLSSLKFGISTVIKENEKLSYWAIVHKDSRPNFHHFDSFIGKF